MLLTLALFSRKRILKKKNEKQLNEDFTNICEWFAGNKLRINFRKDKTKSILFASKLKVRTVRKLNTTWKNL